MCVSYINILYPLQGHQCRNCSLVVASVVYHKVSMALMHQRTSRVIYCAIIIRLCCWHLDSFFFLWLYLDRDPTQETRRPYTILLLLLRAILDIALKCSCTMKTSIFCVVSYVYFSSFLDGDMQKMTNSFFHLIKKKTDDSFSYSFALWDLRGIQVETYLQQSPAFKAAHSRTQSVKMNA